MSRVYYCTKPLSCAGGALCIYLSKDWDIGLGEQVNITVYQPSVPDVKFKATRSVGKNGAGQVVFIDKSWGLEKEDLVTLELRRLDDGQDA